MTDDERLDDDQQADSSPAADSPGGDSPGGDSESGPTEVHYWFPVEIELVGAADDTIVERVMTYVFDELQRELASRQ